MACDKLYLSGVWRGDFFYRCPQVWVKDRPNMVELPIFIMWDIWLTRNNYIFEGIRPDPEVTSLKNLAFFQKYHIDKFVNVDSSFKFSSPNLQSNISMGCFDGASSCGICGVGLILKFSQKHSFHSFFTGGRGSNTESELQALWGLL
jgi:hypothetical protein